VGSLVGGKLNRLASGIAAMRYPCAADMLNDVCRVKAQNLVSSRVGGECVLQGRLWSKQASID
jgi:hypothetical protein